MKRAGLAIQIGGSYFPARLAIVEHLYQIRKQGKVLLFREVNDRDSIAVGAWHVRESLRHAFERQPECYDDLKDVLKQVFNRLRMPYEKWHQNSQLLPVL